jgi:hypothetical protein
MRNPSCTRRSSVSASLKRPQAGIRISHGLSSIDTPSLQSKSPRVSFFFGFLGAGVVVFRRRGETGGGLGGARANIYHKLSMCSAGMALALFTMLLLLLLLLSCLER